MTYALRYIASEIDVYTKTGLDATEVDITLNDNQLINEGESEVEILTGRKFTATNSITEYISAPRKDVLGYSGTEAKSIILSEYPILTITELKVLDTTGAASTTYATWTGTSSGYETADYWIEAIEEPLAHGYVTYGKITLKNATFPVGTRNIKVSYTYGYATTPTLVRDLATCLIGIRQWISKLGGCYNRIDSYSIPQQTVSKGDFYVRGEKAIAMLRTEADRLLDRIGRRANKVFFASSADR